MENRNKMFFYKYFYIIIIFICILAVPFFALRFQDQYYDVVDEFIETVEYSVSEEFSPATRNKVLSLSDEVKIAKITFHYKTFMATMIIIVFLSLFSYLYYTFGMKFKCLSITPSNKLNKNIVFVISIVEIVYFVGVRVFAAKELIGNHFWTLFFVNIIIVILAIVVLLQLQFLLKSKQDSH